MNLCPKTGDACQCQPPTRCNIFDAVCPDCQQPASRTLAIGWLFRCDPCKREWGHPQWINTAEASELLHDLRAAWQQHSAGVAIHRGGQQAWTDPEKEPRFQPGEET